MNKKVFSQRIQELSEEGSANPEDFFQINNRNMKPKQQQSISQNVYTPSTPPSQRINEEMEWFSEEDNEAYEGQLAVDVYQDNKSIYIKTAIAGINPDDVEVHLNNDMLTIRGKREHNEEVNDEQFFIRECYWGGFSRSIILPVDVKQDQVKANIENGVLTITLPKSKRPRNTRIKVAEVKS